MAKDGLLDYNRGMARRASRSLAALARKIRNQPWNRAGADKTFVYTALTSYLAYIRAIRH